MIKEVEIRIPPADLHNEQRIRQFAIKKSGIPYKDIGEVRVLRRSIDARRGKPRFLLRVAVYSLEENITAEAAILDNFQSVEDKPNVIIVGAGPAGYFAALELIELGLKPIIFDRGKDVQARRKDLRAIQQFGIVNSNSNYCFGEGGAGTYSDGKLYTRSHKRGRIAKALQLLVEHGANSDIMVDAHPHIGSNKLPKIIANIRETILHFGGEVHFESLVTDFIVDNAKMSGVVVNGDKTHKAQAVILATGHSARDIYYLLHRNNIKIEAKPFALGVRIEHPQALIDEIQYREKTREENLPAASYKLVCQVEKRGVFSFCMCPGGLIVPSATAPGEIVVNGMSLSRRDSPFANSGTVVAVELEDLKDFQQHDIFAGLEFQKSVEQSMYNLANDDTQKAPAQRLTDFVNGRVSSSLVDTSYIPGLVSAPLHEILPDFIYKRLQKGVQAFGKKMKGYYTDQANVIATESRTSSPIRVPRDRKTYMHIDVEGLFPCGEGAGYAGGIISAAMDGQNVSKAVHVFYGN